MKVKRRSAVFFLQLLVAIALLVPSVLYADNVSDSQEPLAHGSFAPSRPRVRSVSAVAQQLRGGSHHRRFGRALDCSERMRWSTSLRSWYALTSEAQILALTIIDRESILRALDDPPTDALAELRATLLVEREWRVREGLE